MAGQLSQLCAQTFCIYIFAYYPRTPLCIDARDGAPKDTGLGGGDRVGGALGPKKKPMRINDVSSRWMATSRVSLTRPAPRRHGAVSPGCPGSRLRSPRHRVRDKPRATGVATHAATQGHQPHNGQGEVPHTRRRSAVNEKVRRAARHVRLGWFLAMKARSTPR